ncbi:MAG: hypothetical protein JW873_01860 [Candidatus Saganbacteria bacterium]|nr:hypothetical protein [Candidatus Saganbacteria bacterium]
MGHQLLAEIPALAKLAGRIEVLPFRSKVVVVDTGVRLADSLKRINRDSRVLELERGLAFLPGELTNFGQAVDMMKSTLSQHGLTRVGSHSVTDLVARSRCITARLGANHGRMEIHFSIYRHLDSLLDYVRVAVPLPGLEFRPHPRSMGIFFLTES